MSEAGVPAVEMIDRRLRPIGIVLSVALVVIAVLLATRGGAGDDLAIDTTPHLVDATELAAFEDSLGHAVYWVGERPQDQLEITEEADGSIYLRYLPPGTEVGDPRTRFLTVGTYPVADAAGGLRRTAAEEGAVLGHTADGGVVLVNPSSEGSVYLAYPGSDLQIEVYDSAPGRALGLIRSGAVERVG